MEDTGCLVAFKLHKEIKSTARTSFFRELYGCRDKSNYGKYVYERKGILDEIPHVQLARAVIIVRNDDKEKLLEFLKGNAEVHVREVKLENKDKVKLEQKSQ